MIDIHTHILPGVDDGSIDLENSLIMLKQANEQGVTHLVLTPHSILNSRKFLSKEDLFLRFQKLVNAAKDIPIQLYLGSEIFYTDKVISKLDSGELQTFSDSKYLLIEFSMRNESDLDEILYNIRVKGFQPILAHPERYEYMTVEKLKQLKENALIQINSTSIEGFHGRKAKKKAFEFLKEGLVDFVSSDCHNSTTRTCSLKKSYEIVFNKFGEETARAIFENNQLIMIQEIDKYLDNSRK
ncbi:MAG: CpsB/CapC family capsule biosynthesis tyrosine phosphatase [Bacilli bacterium]